MDARGSLIDDAALHYHARAAWPSLDARGRGAAAAAAAPAAAMEKKKARAVAAQSASPRIGASGGDDSTGPGEPSHVPRVPAPIPAGVGAGCAPAYPASVVVPPRRHARGRPGRDRDAVRVRQVRQALSDTRNVLSASKAAHRAHGAKVSGLRQKSVCATHQAASHESADAACARGAV